jgi:hypothetical protein
LISDVAVLPARYYRLCPHGSVVTGAADYTVSLLEANELGQRPSSPTVHGGVYLDSCAGHTFTPDGARLALQSAVEA